jgi:hypothetical protein
MTSRSQKLAILREFQLGRRAMPAGRFERMGSHSPRVRCVMCWAVGFGPIQPTPWDVSPWQIPCLLEHTAECRSTTPATWPSTSRPTATRSVR